MKYIKKALLIFCSLLMSLFFVDKYIETAHFNKVLSSILKMTGLNVEFDSVSVTGLRNLEAHNVIVKDQKGEDVIIAKRAKAKINLLVPSRLLKIEIEEPTVNLRREKNNYFNVFGILKSDTRKIKANDRTSRLGRLYIKNAQLNYEDISFKEKIEKKLYNIDGFLEMNKSLGFVLEAKGVSDGETIGVKLGDVMSFTSGLLSFFETKESNSKDNKNFYTHFFFDSVQLNEKFAQYIPIDLISVQKGVLSGDLRISNENIEKTLKVVGNLDVQSGKIKYTDYSKVIENIEGKINLDENKVILNAAGEVDNRRADLGLSFMYKEEKLDLDLKVFDMPYKLISEYKLLKDLNFNFDGNIDGNIHLDYFNKDKKVNLYSEFSTKELFFNDNRLQNVKGKMEFSDENEKKLIFKDVNFYFEKNINKFYVKNNVNINKFDYFIDEKKGKGNFVLKNSGSNYKINKIFGNLSLKENKFLDVSFNSNELEGKVNINLEKSDLVINAQSKKDFKIKYNNQDYKIEPKVDNLYVDLKEKDILRSGNIDTKLVFLNNDIIGPLDTKIVVNEGKLDIEAQSEYGEGYLEYENLKIRGNIENLSEFNLDMDVDLEELWIGYQRFKNLKGKLNLFDNKLTIKDFSNKKLKLDGFYNLSDGFMNFNTTLKNYVLYNTSTPEVNIYVEKLDGYVNGTLDKLNGEFILEPSKTYLDNEHIGEIQGNLKLENSVVNIGSLTLRNNEIYGGYDLNTGLIDFTINVDEPELSKLLKIGTIDFGSKLSLKMQGELNNFNILGNLELSDVVLKGIIIPETNISVRYERGDINKLFKYGNLYIDELSFIDEKENKLFSTSTSFDLENINVDYVIENQKIVLDNIKSFKESGYSGEIDLSFIVKGKPEDYFIDFKLKSDKLLANEFRLEKVEIDAQANNEGLRIGEFYLEYEKNPLLFSGFIGFKPLNYNMTLFAENFNLDFLGLNKDVKNASGIANVNLTFSDLGTEGEILLDDFNYTLKDKSTDVKNLNANISVFDKKLILNKLYGGYNGGVFKVEGELDIPWIPNDFLETKKVEIGGIEVNMALNKVGIKYGKDLDFVTTGYLSLTEDKLYGALNIDSGELRGIPSFGEDKKLSEEERKKILANKTIVQSFVEEVIDKIVKQYTVQLFLQTRNNFKLNMNSISLIRNIKGDVLGDLKVHYSGGEVNLLGDISIKKGTFSVNGNRFLLNNADVRFTNLNETLENINPLVNLEATSIIGGEKIYIGMNGNLKNSEISLKSDSNLSRNQILSLLAFSTTTGKTEGDDKLLSIFEGKDKSRTTDENRIILGSVVNRALSQFLFSPVIDRIGETFGLTNASLNTEFNKNVDLNEGYLATAKLYLQKDVYKNKIFANAEIKFPFKVMKSSTNLNSNSNNNFIGYNLWFNYNISPSVSLKIGGETIRVVEKEQEKLYNIKNGDYTNRIDKKVNYYMGISFSESAKSFNELIKKIFYRKKLETLTKEK